jgi:hypothetical protein
MFYPTNFDDSDFQAVNWREFKKTIDDPCAIQQRNQDNTKKLKFITTNHRDLLDGKENLNFYGMTVKDKLFVPSDKMDVYSELRQGKSGNILTNCNVKNEFGQLPFPTMPSRYQLHHGDVDKEDSMRFALLEANRKTCNPSDAKYFERYFYIFDDKLGVETPNALKSVQTHTMGPRGGLSTRFANGNKK